MPLAHSSVDSGRAACVASILAAPTQSSTAATFRPTLPVRWPSVKGRTWRKVDKPVPGGRAISALRSRCARAGFDEINNRPTTWDSASEAASIEVGKAFSCDQLASPYCSTSCPSSPSGGGCGNHGRFDSQFSRIHCCSVPLPPRAAAGDWIWSSPSNGPVHYCLSPTGYDRSQAEEMRSSFEIFEVYEQLGVIGHCPAQMPLTPKAASAPESEALGYDIAEIYAALDIVGHVPSGHVPSHDEPCSALGEAELSNRLIGEAPAHLVPSGSCGVSPAAILSRGVKTTRNGAFTGRYLEGLARAKQLAEERRIALAADRTLS